VRVLYGYDDSEMLGNFEHFADAPNSDDSTPNPAYANVNKVYKLVHSGAVTAFMNTFGILFAVIYGLIIALFEVFLRVALLPGARILAHGMHAIAKLWAYSVKPIAAILLPWNKN
jgi:hypothetical protein